MAPGLFLSVEEKIKLLLLLATKRRHNLSYSAAQDIMELSGVFTAEANEKPFLPTKHIMKSVIDTYSFGLSEHHVCPVCVKYIGVVKETTFYCSACKKSFST